MRSTSPPAEWHSADSRTGVSRRSIIGAGLGAAAAVVLAACGDDGPPRARPVAADNPWAAMTSEELIAEYPGPRVDVLSRDNTFQPRDIEVAAGTLVVWTNGGRNEHDIYPVEGDDWGVAPADFPPGAVYAHVFDTPGPVPYYCSIHGNHTVGMVGSITVTDAAPA